MTIKIPTASATAAAGASAVTPGAAFAAGTPNQTRNRGRGALELLVAETPLVEAPAVETRHVETPVEAAL